ncbi:hypothetical protein ACFLXI_05905 [Chloroflexota bacterium]
MSHYAKMEGIFNYLPHITLKKTYSTSQFRVLYASTELSIYKIQLYCDLEVTIEKENGVIAVGKLNGKKPVKPNVGLHSSRGMASFVSTSRFISDGENTRIYYHLHLKGELPTPRAFSLVPNNITNHIAENITKHRIYEIADGFIIGSLADFEKKKSSSTTN